MPAGGGGVLTYGLARVASLLRVSEAGPPPEAGPYTTKSSYDDVALIDIPRSTETLELMTM